MIPFVGTQVHPHTKYNFYHNSTKTEKGMNPLLLYMDVIIVFIYTRAAST